MTFCPETLNSLFGLCFVFLVKCLKASLKSHSLCLNSNMPHLSHTISLFLRIKLGNKGTWVVGLKGEDGWAGFNIHINFYKSPSSSSLNFHRSQLSCPKTMPTFHSLSPFFVLFFTALEQGPPPKDNRDSGPCCKL